MHGKQNIKMYIDRCPYNKHVGTVCLLRHLWAAAHKSYSPPPMHLPLVLNYVGNLTEGTTMPHSSACPHAAQSSGPTKCHAMGEAQTSCTLPRTLHVFGLLQITFNNDVQSLWCS